MKAWNRFSYFFMMQLICLVFFTNTSWAQPSYEWTTRLTGKSFCKGLTLATDKFGNVYVAGFVRGKFDLDNGLGITPITSSNIYNSLISKYDSTGTLLWAKTFEAAEPFKITVDDSCNIYFLGAYEGTVDFDPDSSVHNMTAISYGFSLYVCKWDSAGSFKWVNNCLINSFSIYSNSAASIKVNNTGAVQVVGSIISNYLFIAEFNNVGTMTFSRIISFGYSVSFNSLSVDTHGNIVAIGLFSLYNDFDPGPGTDTLYASNGEIFILKLTSQGDLIWAKNFGSHLSLNYASSITTDSLCNIYFSGQMQDTVDFDFGPGVYNLISEPTVKRSFIASCDSSLNFVFAKLLDQFSINNLSIQNNNGLVATGQFSSTVDFDPGPMVYSLTSPISESSYICKYDLTGNFEYAKILGGKNISISTSDINSDILITGYFDKTTDLDPSQGAFPLITQMDIPCIFLCKLDSSANCEWVRSSHGSLTYPMDQDVDQDGNFYTTGYFLGNIDFDPDTSAYNLNYFWGKDIFIQKINSSGKLAWAKCIGSNNSEFAEKVKTDNSGNVYLTGSIYGTVDCDPGPAVYNLTPQGTLSKSSFLLKLDAAGNFVWATTIFDHEVDNNLDYDMDVDGSGNIYFTGNFDKTIDLDPGPGNYYLTEDFNLVTKVFMVKLNTNGNFEWGHNLVSPNGDAFYFNNISVDGSGNSIYSGVQYFDTIDYDPGPGVFNMSASTTQCVFLKLDPQGNFIWAKQIGSFTENEYDVVKCQEIFADSDGDIIIAGCFSGPGPIDFDPNSGIDTVTSAYQNGQIFTSKWNNAGNLIWNTVINGEQNFPMSITELNSGRVLITGQYSTPPNELLYFADFDSSGILLAKYFFGQKEPFIGSDEFDNIYLFGTFRTPIDFDLSVGVNTIKPSTREDFYTSKYTVAKPLCSVNPSTIYANIVGNTICSGQNVALTQSGGVLSSTGFYEWYLDSCGGTLIDTGESITVAPTDTSTFFLRTVDSCGVSSCLSFTINVISSPVAPIVTGNASFCPGDSITLTASSGFQTYLWSTGSQTPSIDVSTEGTYIITVTSTNGCSNSASVQVTTFPNPPATITPSSKVFICRGDTVPFSVTNSAGYTYQWYRNAIPIPGETMSTFNAFSNGLYSCMVTDSNTCDSTTQNVRVKIICLPPFDDQSKIENETVPPLGTEMLVFYDISSATAHIKINNKSLVNFMIQLTDVTGKLVFKTSGYANSPDYEYLLNCSTFAPGAYLITFTSEKEKLTGKFTKM